MSSFYIGIFLKKSFNFKYVYRIFFFLHDITLGILKDQDKGDIIYSWKELKQSKKRNSSVCIIEEKCIVKYAREMF